MFARMRIRLVVALAVILSMIGSAAAGADEGEMLTLTGSVVYGPTGAPPADGVLTVTLEDVSLADAPSVTLGQTQFGVAGLPAPIAFAVSYPGSAVVPGATYSARARVTSGDRLLFTTTVSNPVDPFNPVPLQLVLEPVAVAEPTPVPDAALTGTYWKLVEVQGTPVSVADQTREPNLVLAQDGRFAGAAGVNRLMGGYSLAGESLTFTQVAATLMAGAPEEMQQEQAILAALDLVRGFRISGNDLSLVGDAGQPVLQAVAVAPN
ncbi:MAG: META domain-containing protein [Mycobacterium sp.]|nr:META domain-containing protein [Mycobacterium sp.]